MTSPQDPGIGAAYTLRPAEREDFEFTYRLVETSFRHLVERVRPWDGAEERSHLRERFRPGLDSIVMVGRRPVGHLGVRETEASLELGMIVIDPEYQGRGIGTALIESVLERGGMIAKPVTLWVNHDNQGAIRLYRRLGFRVVREVERPERRERRLLMTVDPRD